MKVSVVVVAGLHSDVAAAAVMRMVVAAPAGTAVVEYDIGALGEGRVTRTLRDTTGSRHLVVELAHGCVGCMLRESVLPTLAECAREGNFRRVILVLPAAIEPEAVAHALAAGTVVGVPMSRLVEVHAVVTAVDPSRLLADIDGSDTLADRGLACAPQDERFVAEVVLRQVEHADVLVGPYANVRGLDMLAHLNPGAEFLTTRLAGGLVHGARRHDPRAAAVRSEPGAAFAPLSFGSGSVSTLVWRSRRPLEPVRFHNGLERLVPAVIRTRGHVWLASHPEVRYAFSTTGPRVELRPAGPWLDATPPERWERAGQAHRARAAMDWDPELGDRGNELVLTGLDVDGGALHDLLDSMILTQKDFGAVPDGWRSLPDPFVAALRR